MHELNHKNIPSALPPAPYVLRSSGFTLFEVLMAMAILGVLLSLLYMTFHQSMAAVAQTEERAEVIQQGRMILERIAGDLRGAFLPDPQQQLPSPAFVYGLVGKSTKEGDTFRDRIDFSASTPPYAVFDKGAGEIVEIGYFLDHAPGAKGLTLFRRQDLPGDGDLLRGGRTLPICDGVRGLNFVYFSRDAVKEKSAVGRKDWDTLQGAQRNQLPRRIAMELALEDARGRVHTFRTQVYLSQSGEPG
jgi:prepilin-type N-terminal cleavage/methylation domain-containing protein